MGGFSSLSDCGEGITVGSHLTQLSTFAFKSKLLL